MAQPPLATPSDLAAWIGVGQTSLDDDPRAGAVLSAASALVRAYTGETWLLEDDTLGDVPADVAAIVVQVAARVWSNPDGLTSVTIDDSTRRWGESGTSGLYLTAAEKEMLQGYRSSSSATGLGSIGVTRGDVGHDTIYVPTGPPPSGYPFPWYPADGY